ncbi:6-phosphogluconolactonase [candidate division KSB1 bacterium]
MPHNDLFISPVEKIALQKTHFDAIYLRSEKIKTIIVENFPALGKLAAMRFIEWVQNNPGGVISLPTGKTPEYFIKWVVRLLETWETKETQKELEENGIDPAVRPDMKGLYFVQIDEFYPIEPSHHNSFYYYVNKYYIDDFGLDPEKALLINCEDIGLEPGDTLETVWLEDEVDLSLRYRLGKDETERKQKTVIERIDQWCQNYEEKIRELGGIGFFLGGIGPDGHIGFNIRGSDHLSTTRLTQTNYETQAAAAQDLGGIEVSKKRLVITIGLGTIAYNLNCTAVIIAAGEAKAKIVGASIQNERSKKYPATILQLLPNSAFYITKGASRDLVERELVEISRERPIKDEKIEEIIVDLSLKTKKAVRDLNKDDFAGDRRAELVLNQVRGDVDLITAGVFQSLTEKIKKGLTTLENTKFLHTEPHHDDLMLGCLPYIVRHVRSATNTHYFVTLTSGFTSVSNIYMQKILENLKDFINSPAFMELQDENYFDPDNTNARNRDIWHYLDGVAADSEEMKNEGTSRRLLRNLMSVYIEKDINKIRLRIAELHNYFVMQYPGKKDIEEVQLLKGMCREWEAECLWGYFGWNCQYIIHKRLGFYTGDLFTEDPTLDRDVPPIIQVLEDTNPDVVTVAFDPEVSGPDTHYKVLQALTEALNKYEKNTGKTGIKILGYRNVWYRFHPAEANIFIPVSLNMFSIMQSAFMSTFNSQKDASFPTYEHDGPFSELAQKIQVEQYQNMEICLGKEWFHENPKPLIRATRGLVFLKDISTENLYLHCRALRQITENR